MRIPFARSIAFRAASASASVSTSSRTAVSSSKRARAVAIAGIRSCSRNGLARYPKTPASAARSTSASSVYALTITIGSGRSPRMRRAASIPSRPGIFTSRIATSGCSERASSTASAPLRASAHTTRPTRSSIVRRSRRINVSSSPTSTLTRRSPGRSTFRRPASSSAQARCRRPAKEGRGRSA